MAPPKDLHVLIAGAGIAGLTLGIIFEKAGIRYTILEKAKELKPLGSGLVLTAQVLRVFDQLGVLEDLMKISMPGTGAAYYFQDNTKIAEANMSMFEETFGYSTRHFARCELVQVLLRHLSTDNIKYGKKILNTMQRAENGVMVRCADGSSFDGDILIGADGAYSAVRQSMYKNMALKGMSVAESDTAPLRFESFSILGVTKSLDENVQPILWEKKGKLHCHMGSRDKPYIVTLLPVGRGRVAWFIRGKFLEVEFHDQDSFRFTDWDNDNVQDVVKELEQMPIVIGGTVGTLFNNTEQISRVLLEDRWFTTWYDGRTVLVGDACHKTLPAAGQGAIQAILDCVCLANLLYELPSKEPQDIEMVFAKYFELRGSTAQKVVETSKKISGMTAGNSWLLAIMRIILLKLMATPLFQRVLNRSMSGRPVLNFLPKPQLRGVPDTSPDMTLGLVQPDFEVQEVIAA